MSRDADYPGVFERGARVATVAVFFAFVVVFFGTVAIFQIEDDNPLTGAAFDAVPLLGASLLCAHLAVLAALVIIVVGVGRITLTMWGGSTGLRVRVFACLSFCVVFVAAVAAAGLIVLYVRLGGSIVSSLTDLSRIVSSVVVAFALLAFIVASLSVGHRIVGRHQADRQTQREVVGVLGFLIGAVLAMLVNVGAAITHTVALGSGSPDLFADSIDHVTITGYGSTSGFYFSELIVANIVAGAFVVGAAILVARAVVGLRSEQDVPTV